MPRMSFGPALSLGLASYGEYMDIDLTAPWSGAAVMDALNRELPDGLTIVEAEAHGLDVPTIDHALEGFTYSVSLAQLAPSRLSDETIAARLAAFESATSFPMAKRIKGRTRTIDARASVTVRRSGDRMLQVETAVTRGGTLKPHDVVATLLGLSELEAQLLAVTKTGTMLASTSPLPSPAISLVASAAPPPCPS
jgi:radical SAM-linked protein